MENERKTDVIRTKTSIGIFIILLLLLLSSCGQTSRTTIEARLYKFRIEGTAPDSYHGIKEGETAYLVFRRFLDVKGETIPEVFCIKQYSAKEKEMMDQASSGSLLKITLPPDVEAPLIPNIYPYSIKLVKKDAPVIEQEVLDYLAAHGWSYPLLDPPAEIK